MPLPSLKRPKRLPAAAAWLLVLLVGISLAGCASGNNWQKRGHRNAANCRCPH